MGDYERRSQADKERRDHDEAVLNARNIATWQCAVIAWRDRRRFGSAPYIFEVTRGTPAMGNSLNMEAGFNDSFDVWNYCKHTWGATSFVRNVWASGKMLISVEAMLRIFPDPQSFADAVAAVEPD